MPLISQQTQKDDGPTASILSSTATTGSVNVEIKGGGTLTEEDNITISIPSSVKLTEYLVSNGEVVTKGQPIAVVDSISIMNTIADIQETLDYLAEEIENVEETENEVTALAGDTVKAIYAAEGTSVQDLMLEHGTLAVLSLDGLMAVKFSTESDLTAGTKVTASIGKETTIDARIDSNLAGEMVVTFEDSSYPIGEMVQISDSNGNILGSGELYIYSPWNATAYTGVIDTISVEKGDTVKAGEKLITLTNVEDNAIYHQLLNQRQEYQEQMAELFQMYKNETILAPYDGVISGADQDNISIVKTENETDSVAELETQTQTAQVQISKSSVGISRSANSSTVQPLSVNTQNNPEFPSDILSVQDIPTHIPNSPDIPTHIPNGEEVPQYPEKTEEETIPDKEDSKDKENNNKKEDSKDKENNKQEDSEDNIENNEKQDFTDNQAPIQENPPTMQEIQTNQDISVAPNVPTNPELPQDSATSSFPQIQGENGMGMFSDPRLSSGGTMQTTPNMNFPFIEESLYEAAGFPQENTLQQQEDQFQLSSLERKDIASITPQNTMTLTINVNELDISSLEMGMSAEVQIPALGGEKFTATITDIGNTGTNNGGYSYFTVKLTMERTEDMLMGMNATATLVTNVITDVITIPVDALSNDGANTLLYTGYDKETGTLQNPIPVTTGASDGEMVEILDGLQQGTTYYYTYYDTLEISSSPDFSSRGFFGF